MFGPGFPGRGFPGRGGPGRGGAGRGGRGRGGGARGGPGRGGPGRGGAGRGGRGMPSRGGRGGQARGGQQGGFMNGKQNNRDGGLKWRYQGCVGTLTPFFIDPQRLLMIKKQVINECKESKEVVPICQENARFVYIKKARDVNFALQQCGKQPDWVRAGKGFSCGSCDVYTDTHEELKRHNETLAHKEVIAVFKRLDRTCREWHKQFHDPDFSLSAYASECERNGMTVDNSDVVTSAATTTPLNDLLFQNLDYNSLTEEEFVLASYDSIMEVHWPKPITDFYCRECNYMSFLSQEQLDIHKGSAEHQNFEMNYSTSWCVSCQFHTGTPSALAAHNETARHKMIVKMLEDVRLKSLEFYKRCSRSKTAATTQFKGPQTGQSAPKPLMVQDGFSFNQQASANYYGYTSFQDKNSYPNNANSPRGRMNQSLMQLAGMKREQPSPIYDMQKRRFGLERF